MGEKVEVAAAVPLLKSLEPSVAATLEGRLGWWKAYYVAVQSRPVLMIFLLLRHILDLILALTPLFCHICAHGT
jgi:hypothetical protein